MTKDIIDAINENIIIGFLPNLSDKRPKNGEAKNCPMEKVAAIRPICRGEALNVSAKKGKRGKTIPNPMILTKTVKYIQKNSFLIKYGQK